MIIDLISNVDQGNKREPQHRVIQLCPTDFLQRCKSSMKEKVFSINGTIANAHHAGNVTEIKPVISIWGELTSLVCRDFQSMNKVCFYIHLNHL